MVKRLQAFNRLVLVRVAYRLWRVERAAVSTAFSRLPR